MRRAFPLVVALALLGADGVAAQSIDTEIAERVAEVQSATDPSMRIDRAAHLAEYIARPRPLDVAHVKAACVDEMAELLEKTPTYGLLRGRLAGFLRPSGRRLFRPEKALKRPKEKRILPGHPSF